MNNKILELERQLAEMKKAEKIEIEKNKKLTKEKLLQEYDIFWDNERFSKLIKQYCYLDLQIDDGYNMFWIRREFLFWDSWDETFCEIKYNMSSDEYYDKYETDFEMNDFEYEFLINKIHKFLNHTINEKIKSI